LLRHGHAVPLPSPAQYAVPIAASDGVKQYAYDAVQSCSHVWSVFGSNRRDYCRLREESRRSAPSRRS
jgi:hypothetical protein